MKNKETTWDSFKKYINSREVGDVIRRIELLSCIDHNSAFTIDSYRGKLTNIHIKILQGEELGRYKLLRKIPDNMRLTDLDKIATERWKNPWKVWFITLEDHIKHLHEKKGINNARS